MDDEQRTIDILDLQEDRGPVPVLDAAGARELLRTARRIAVVGASPDPARPSNDVMAYLLAHGYACVPVNPRADEVLGIRTFPDLPSAVAAGGPFDIVDVFRRADQTPEVARQAVATGARALWLQLGVVSWEAATIAVAGGLPIVMDRCTKIEHHALRLPRPG